MGNRTALSLGNCGEFEANNCLPVTWLALFATQEFLVETREEDSEKYDVAIYRTSQASALQRVTQTIGKLKGHTPAWSYLRPLEILKDELGHCLSDELINLDVTQLWVMDESFRQKVSRGISAFAEMLNRFTGDKEQDLAMLNQLVNDFSIAPISSVADLSAEEKMFLLIGTYWGDEDREALYSLEYFSEGYWSANS